MFSDDVYRKELGGTIAELEDWVRQHNDCAQIISTITPMYWKMSVSPSIQGACPFELLLRSDQKFDLQIAGELYEDKPVDAFAFFPMLARAIAGGAVDRILITSTLTGALEAVETRVTLDDGRVWIGERWLSRRSLGNTEESASEQRCHRYLRYRR